LALGDSDDTHSMNSQGMPPEKTQLTHPAATIAVDDRIMEYSQVNLTSDHPFWFMKSGLLNTYPFLHRDIVCDVAVVGAGITGAMVAHRLSTDGHSVVVIDGRDVCRGSTSASTALLQYEIDVSLTELAKRIGKQNATRAYRLSHQAIDDFEQLIDQTKANCGFRRKHSLQIAYTRKAAKALADEHRARKCIGLDSSYHDSGELLSLYGLNGVSALSNNQAASCDAYELGHELLAAAVRSGAEVFDRTQVTQFNCSADRVVLFTSREMNVTAKHVVIATGYEAHSMLKERVVDLHNTYAVVSQPLESVSPWNSNWMLWEAQTPYLYLRCTDDQRILVGGEDDSFHSPYRRDRSIQQKAHVIHAKTRALIPELEWEIEFAWGGTFGSTKDGLAYVGRSPEYPGCLFTLGFGGNGITFSVIATKLISEMVRGLQPENADLFRFGR
jgi:glycine/D-amino acid oxidase-like deaminating enzyme